MSETKEKGKLSLSPLQDSNIILKKANHKANNTITNIIRLEYHKWH
jgi:hypothetical protein